MFKYIKEMRELKKAKLRMEYLLFAKVYGFVDGLPDIVEMAKKAKDLSVPEVQKLIVEELVKYMKDKEDVANNETTEDGE